MTFGEKTTVEDISTYRYIVPPETFRSPTNEPANSCFCRTGGDDLSDSCQTDGVLDISGCNYGAPILVSLFYG